MEKAFEHFSKQLGCITGFGGVNNTLLIENLKIDGTFIKHMATVSGRNRIEVRPFDSNNLKVILDECTKSGLSAYIASKTTIVVSAPQIDNEDKVRVEKQIKKMAEETKITIRNVRRKFNIGDETTKGYISKVEKLVTDKLTILASL